MTNKDENLKEILNKFYADAESAKIEEEILRGERIISDNPAPQPDTRLISDIKACVRTELTRREKRTVFTYMRAAAAAAVLIVGVTVFMTHRGEQQNEPGVAQGTIPQSIWESEDLMDDDVELAMLAASIDAVEDEVLSLRFDEQSDEVINIDEVEIEVMEISDDFWKG